jgi:hypothetical protein
MIPHAELLSDNCQIVSSGKGRIYKEKSPLIIAKEFCGKKVKFTRWSQGKKCICKQKKLYEKEAMFRTFVL